MKTIKIPENEKEVKRAIEESIKNLEKRGIRIYAVIGECPALDRHFSNAVNPYHYGVKQCAKIIDCYMDFTKSVVQPILEELFNDKDEDDDASVKGGDKND